MATKNEDCCNARPKREEFSDFELVLKDGTELQCHHRSFLLFNQISLCSLPCVPALELKQI